MEQQILHQTLQLQVNPGENLERMADQAEKCQGFAVQAPNIGEGVSEFTLYQSTGHFIIEADNGPVVIDTGCPFSVSRTGSVLFMGREYPTSRLFLNVDMDQVSRTIGMHLEALVGLDVLRNYTFMIDTRIQKMSFSENKINWPMHHIVPLTNYSQGIPVTKVTIKEQSVSLYVDTGAPRTYLFKYLTKGCDVVGEYKDGSPYAGSFAGPLYAVPADLYGEKVILKCGSDLPEILETGLMYAGMQGILGMDLAEKYRLGFALKEGKMALIHKIGIALT